MTETLSTKQAAERLGVTPRTIVFWIGRDTFPNAYKLNPDAPKSPYRIPVSDIEAVEAKRGQSV